MQQVQLAPSFLKLSNRINKTLKLPQFKYIKNFQKAKQIITNFHPKQIICTDLHCYQKLVAQLPGYHFIFVKNETEFATVVQESQNYQIALSACATTAGMLATYVLAQSGKNASFSK